MLQKVSDHEKPRKHPGGAPSKYGDLNLRQLEKLAATGMTDNEMADFFEISEATLNNYKKQHPEFLESLKRGKAIADERVERSLFERATGYTHPEEAIFNNRGKIIRVKTTKHYPPDATSIIFWLKNRRPHTWRDRHEVKANLLGLRPLMLPDNGMNAKLPEG